MQQFDRTHLEPGREAPSIEALLPAAGAMSALCLMFMALLFLI